MNWANILFGVYLGAAAVQITYLAFIFSRLATVRLHKTDNNADRQNDQLPFVSVVICARDEAANLKKNLPLILAQNYPSFEVVVVNDDSEDDTASVLQELSAVSKHLHVSQMLGEKPYPGKKFPLTMGIKACKGDILLLTDADCRPASPDWIRTMAGKYDRGTEIVLGYGAYEREAGFLNKIVRYETFQTFLQYASYALAGLPYMGVGRNLSYSKKLFFQNRGFAGHFHLLSGDDDLFINKAAKSGNTKLCVNPEAFTFSKSPSSWKQWFRQKKRHLSTAKYYGWKSKLMLSLWSGTQLIFYAAFFSLLFFPQWYLVLIIVFLLRLLLQQWVFFKVLRKINALDLWYISTVIDIVQIVYYIIFAPVALAGKNSKWR